MKKQKSNFQQRYERWKSGERVYKNGRPITEPMFDAPWSYDQWVKTMADYKSINMNDPSYDYKSYFDDNKEAAWKMLNDDPSAHFSDKYKTSLHPSASDQSIYSGKVSQHNPRGIKFGRWYGDRLYYAPESLDASWDDIIQNAIYNEPGGLQVRDHYGRLQLLNDGTLFGGSLPEVQIKGMRKPALPKPIWQIIEK